MTFRHDGGPDAVRACMRPVLEHLDEIVGLIQRIAAVKRLIVVDVCVFQSRAMGTCRTDGRSDIDTYVQLSPAHADLIDRRGTYLIEGHHPTSTYGTWHREELDAIDPYTTGYRWPHRVLHDSQAPDYYREAPAVLDDVVTRLDALGVHITWGIHPDPPRKREYAGPYYIRISELRRHA